MMKKLLFISDGLRSPTGYGTVMLNVLPKLTDDYDVNVFSLTEYGMDYDYMGVHILPYQGDQYGMQSVGEAIRKVNPDFIISLCDSAVHSYYTPTINQFRESGWKGKWFQYTTVDSHIIVKSWVDQVFNEADKVIAMSEFGKKCLIKAGVKNVVCIPHGADINTFKPLKPETKLALKKALNLEDKFIIGIFGKNQRRKRWATFFHAFKKFIIKYKLKPKDIAILCHVDKISPVENEGYFIKVILDNLGIEEYVYWTHAQKFATWRQDIDYKTLNKYYNICDVVYNQQNEGFGLCAIEAISAGTPMIMCDYTTANEFSNHRDHSFIVKKGDADYGANGVIFYSSNENDLVNVLNKAYTNEDIRKYNSIKGRKWVETNYNWDLIADKWKKLFK